MYMQLRHVHVCSACVIHPRAHIRGSTCSADAQQRVVIRSPVATEHTTGLEQIMYRHPHADALNMPLFKLVTRVAVAPPPCDLYVCMSRAQDDAGKCYTAGTRSANSDTVLQNRGKGHMRAPVVVSVNALKCCNLFVSIGSVFFVLSWLILGLTPARWVTREYGVDGQSKSSTVSAGVYVTTK